MVGCEVKCNSSLENRVLFFDNDGCNHFVAHTDQAVAVL